MQNKGFAKFININGKFKPFNDEKDIIDLQNKEIERLENIRIKTIGLLKEAGCYDEETKTFCDDIWEELPKILKTLEGDETNETNNN